MLKRFFDGIVAGIGLIVFCPLIFIIALAIWFEDGRPIFFRQRRFGQNGRIFNVLKFRSMIVNKGVEAQASKNDPRITRVGRLLRKTAMDELPQIWNIFIGDMSFVGPRAQPEREHVRRGDSVFDLAIADVPGFKLRQRVKPGLTGIAQIYAPRQIPHHHKFRYDLLYVKKALAAQGVRGAWAMLWLDVRLMLLSAWNTVAARWEV